MHNSRLHFHAGAILLATLALGLSPKASASPQNLQHFDAFIHHVRQEAQSGQAERILDCFAPMVFCEEGCPAQPASDILGEEAQRFGWKAIGRDVARYADGFVLVDTDGTMTNLQARANGKQSLMEITGNRVKFRRAAGLEGEVIAVLDRGTFPGRQDAARWKLNRDGTEWTPVILEIPDFGQIKGYIGGDYVRPVPGFGDVQLTAAFDGDRWALTGYQRTRTDLEVSCDHPTP